VIVKSESSLGPGPIKRGDNRYDKTDESNKLSYSISLPSDEYLIYIVNEVSKQGKELTRNRSFAMMGRHRFDRFVRQVEQGDQEFDFYNLIKKLMGLETVRVVAEERKSNKDLESYCYSYLFSFGINLDFSIYPLRYIDEFTNSRRTRLRKTRPEEIECPKRVYINELILHYQKALYSVSVDSKYLSYYHILEYFYEQIYNEDLVLAVKNELSNPRFSFKRKKDLDSVVSIIKKRLKYKNDEFLINEQEALTLVLSKYVSSYENVLDELNEIDETLKDYYKSEEVPFSGGTRIDLNNSDSELISKHISGRIYKTRNAIVHSKENGKNKYVPFKNDKDLVKEIPLLRIIAENIIFNSSKEL
jgi:hypothetical protein